MAQQTETISGGSTVTCELAVTSISRRAARVVVSCFLAIVVSVPIIDQSSGAAVAWRQIRHDRDWQTSLRNVESSLEDRSRIARIVRPLAQSALASTLHTGSDQVILGRNGWLFYAPDVRHVTMRGFLDSSVDDPESLRQRRVQSLRQHAPMDAILQFNQQLAARGVRLVIVPTPVKPMVQPEMLSGPLVNASFERFKADVEAAGIAVFDCAPELAAAAAHGQSQFLVTDTHWRPQAMAAAASQLATLVNARVDLPQTLGVNFMQRERAIQGHGDLAVLLNLRQPLTGENVTIAQVIEPSGRLWSPRSDAEILWLGDSFSNIYSNKEMGWGSAAGFAEQFSRSIGRPLDVIRRNDDGAFATRQLLADELARGNDRLAGKKLVVWQFADVS